MTFALRLISIPLLEYAIWCWLRTPYLQITRLVRRSWLLFAALTGTIYLILVLLSVYPTMIIDYRRAKTLLQQSRFGCGFDKCGGAG